MTPTQWLILFVVWLISVAITIVFEIKCEVNIIKNGYTVGTLIKDVLLGSIGGGYFLAIFIIGYCLTIGLFKAIAYVWYYLDKHIFSKRIF